MLQVGLTGGIGSGKSTVLQRFHHHGAQTEDADAIAKELCLPDRPVYQKIVARYGDCVIKKDRTLCRQLLRQIIFTDMSEKKWLEGVLHPKIINSLKQAARTSEKPYLVAAVPLLIECNLVHQFDQLLVIDIDPSLQIKRACKRDQCSYSEIEQIMSAQATRSQRLAHAHEVIDNTNDLAYLYEQVDQLHHKYLLLAASCPP